MQLGALRAFAGRNDQNRAFRCRSADLRLERWNYVTFVNADSRPHTIVSDPVDLHTQCPALNRVGVIPPGESRETGTLAEKTTCGFHGHSAPTYGALQGRIVVD